jgi:hypothetical protein
VFTIGTYTDPGATSPHLVQIKAIHINSYLWISGEGKFICMTISTFRIKPSEEKMQDLCGK